MKKLGSALLVSVLAAAIFAGCGGDDSSDTATPAAPATGTTAAQAKKPESDQKKSGNKAAKSSKEKVPVQAVSEISDPDDPESVRKAADTFSKNTAEVFNQRDPKTFCAMVDPEFIEQEFDGNIEGCEKQMKKLFAPNSETTELTPGELTVTEDGRATAVMTGPDGKSAGTAEYVQRGNRWYLSMGPVEASDGSKEDGSK